MLRNIRLMTFLMLCGWAATSVPARAQHFEQIPGSLTQIAAGRSEVWGLNGSEVFRFDASSKKFNQISGSLVQIAVGGGSLLQRDQVWGVNAAGTVYRFDFSKNAFARMAGSLNQIAVGKGNADSINPDNCHAYEVWGIGPSPNLGGGLFRYNFCSSSFENIQSPLNNQDVVVQVAVGDSNVWVSDYLNSVFEYINGAWRNGEVFEQFALGVDEDVWGITPDSPDFPGLPGLVRFSPGTGSFEPICIAVCSTFDSPGPSPVLVATGGEGTWVVYSAPPNLEIARYTNLGSQQPIIQGSVFSLLADTGSVVQVAVGSGAGVWVITKRITLGRGGGASYQVWAYVRP
jgi:hypothetical protein